MRGWGDTICCTVALLSMSRRSVRALGLPRPLCSIGHPRFFGHNSPLVAATLGLVRTSVPGLVCITSHAAILVLRYIVLIAVAAIPSAIQLPVVPSFLG